MSRNDGWRVLFVDFDDDGHMHAVYTLEKGHVIGYDFDWSKYYQRHLYVESSSGWDKTFIATGKYWAADDVTVDERGECRRLKTLPRRYSKTKLFEDSYEVDRIMWCSICEDVSDPDMMCEHIHWCPACGEHVTPDEPCEHYDALMRDEVVEEMEYD